MLMVRLVFVFFTLVFFSGFTLSQDKKSVDGPIKNADLRKQMDSIKLEDLSDKLKKAKRLDIDNLNLLRQKIDAKIYIRLENELIERLKTKEVENTLLKLSDGGFKSFLETISVMVPGDERSLKFYEYLEENKIKPDLIKKAIKVKNMEKRVKTLEKIVIDTERKILVAEKWTDEENFVASIDVQSSIEERIDAMIKKNQPQDEGIGKTDKKTSGDSGKGNELVSDLLRFLSENK